MIKTVYQKVVFIIESIGDRLHAFIKLSSRHSHASLLISTGREKTHSIYFRLPGYSFIAIGCVIFLFVFSSVEYIRGQARVKILQEKIDHGEVLVHLYRSKVKEYETGIYTPLLEQLAVLSAEVDVFQPTRLRSRSSQKGGMGGVDLLIADLPSELRLISRDESSKKTRQDRFSPLPKSPRNLSMHALSGKQQEYLSYHNKSLRHFFQKRKQFFHALPTQLPVDRDFSARAKMGNRLLFQTPIGVDVVSSAYGVIVSVKQEDDLLYTVIIDHEYGYITKYKGLMQVVVPLQQEGQKVTKGQRIGITSTRLVYSVKLGASYQDPELYFFSY